MYLVKKSRDSLNEIIVYTAEQTILLPLGPTKLSIFDVDGLVLWITVSLKEYLSIEV